MELDLEKMVSEEKEKLKQSNECEENSQIELPHKDDEIIKENSNENNKLIVNSEDSGTYNKCLTTEDIAKEQANRLNNMIFDDKYSRDDIANIIEKTGFAKSLSDKKNIKKNEKMQKDKYFKEQEVDSKILESMKQAEYEKIVAKEQEEYFSNHKEVLNFARMKEAHSLKHMKFMYWIAIVPYSILSLLHCITAVLGGLIGLMNVFFESAFGQRIVVGYDEEKKPIYDTRRINLFTRIILGVLITAFILFIVFALVDAFTGFDLIEILKKYTAKI